MRGMKVPWGVLVVICAVNKSFAGLLKTILLQVVICWSMLPRYFTLSARGTGCRVFVFPEATFLALSFREMYDSAGVALLEAYILHNENTARQLKKENETCGLTNQMPQFILLLAAHPSFFLILLKQLSWRRKALALNQKFWLCLLLALETQTHDNFSEFPFPHLKKGGFTVKMSFNG